MSLPATENFTGNDGDHISGLSNWAQVYQELDIQSNSCAPDASNEECCARWSADSFNDDHYAEATLVARNTGNPGIGVSVRCQPSASSYYGFYEAFGTMYLFEVTNGSWSQMGEGGAGISVNDVIRLEAEGTTLTPEIDDVEHDPPGAQTDSSFSSGSAGVCGWDDATNHRVDDWEGGNIGAAPGRTTHNTDPYGLGIGIGISRTFK